MEPVGTGLMRIMGELLRNAPAEDAPVLAWPAICGPAVAGRTQGLLFAGGLLRVRVPDHAWRKQLAELENRYVDGFKLLLGNRSVRRIEFVIGVPASE